MVVFFFFFFFFFGGGGGGGCFFLNSGRVLGTIFDPVTANVFLKPILQSQCHYYPLSFFLVEKTRPLNHHLSLHSPPLPYAPSVNKMPGLCLIKKLNSPEMTDSMRN